MRKLGTNDECINVQEERQSVTMFDFLCELLFSLVNEIKAIAFVGSGSALLVLRSLNMSALANGDEDHIIYT